MAADAVRDDTRRPPAFDWPGGLVLRVTARRVGIAVAPAGT